MFSSFFPFCFSYLFLPPPFTGWYWQIFPRGFIIRVFHNFARMGMSGCRHGDGCGNIQLAVRRPEFYPQPVHPGCVLTHGPQCTQVVVTLPQRHRYRCVLSRICLDVAGLCLRTHLTHFTPAVLSTLSASDQLFCSSSLKFTCVSKPVEKCLHVGTTLCWRIQEVVVANSCDHTRFCSEWEQSQCSD